VLPGVLADICVIDSVLCLGLQFLFYEALF